MGPQAALVDGSGVATAAAASTVSPIGTFCTGTSTVPAVTINIAAPAAATPAATTTTAASVGPQAPALPALQNPPAFNPSFGPSASDLPAGETSLTYQIYNLKLLIDRSLTDRIDLQPVHGATRVGMAGRIRSTLSVRV